MTQKEAQQIKDRLPQCQTDQERFELIDLFVEGTIPLRKAAIELLNIFDPRSNNEI